MSKKDEKVVEETKEEKVEETKEVVEEKKDTKKIKPLVTSRILFISVLDKIYLVVLLLMFIGLTIANFKGGLSSMSYGYWSRVGHEIVIIISMVIYYFILNWFYRCAAKTMLCITENEVYKEHYVPFKRTEMSIPLNKITSITTINFFWIFRSLIIFQYHHLPLVYFTWNNQEFKDKFNELVTNRKEKVENTFEEKNILSFVNPKYITYFCIGVVAVIAFIGVLRFFGYVFSPEKKVPGTYVNGNNEVVLNKDGSCNVDFLKDKVTACSWEYRDEAKQVVVTYDYEYSYWYYKDTSTDYKYFNYEKGKLVLDGDTYLKK